MNFQLTLTTSLGGRVDLAQKLGGSSQQREMPDMTILTLAIVSRKIKHFLRASFALSIYHRANFKKFSWGKSFDGWPAPTDNASLWVYPAYGPWSGFRPFSVGDSERGVERAKASPS
jgi:hypothetical protein